MEKLVAHTRKLYPFIKQYCSGSGRAMRRQNSSFLVLYFKVQITDYVGG